MKRNSGFIRNKKVKRNKGVLFFITFFLTLFLFAYNIGYKNYFIQKTEKWVKQVQTLLYVKDMDFAQKDEKQGNVEEKIFMQAEEKSSIPTPMPDFLKEEIRKEEKAKILKLLQFEEEINAKGSIVIEDDIENIMYEKNSKEKLYPASTTKIMTALVALEKGNLEDVVVVTDEIMGIPKDSHIAYISPGDKITLEQLLYGLILFSGNDCAVAIAKHIGGTQENFMEMMNKKAKEIGANHTNFTNPYGYHDSDQYTTAYDLALIAREVWRNPDFRRISTTSVYQAIFRNKNNEEVIRTWNHTSKLVRENTGFDLQGTIGGKTGFTSASGYNLVTFANYKEHDYICIILDGGADERFISTKKLLERAYDSREKYDVLYQNKEQKYTLDHK